MTPLARSASFAVVVAAASVVGCSAPEAVPVKPSPSPIVRSLVDAEPVFGIFSGPKTAEQGALMGQNRETDFVFYSLESGPFDLDRMKLYREGLNRSSPYEPTPFALRIPPIRDDVELARQRVQQGIAAGADVIVFPHVQSAEDAAVAVGAMGPESWPGNPSGRLLNMLIVEDQAGIANVREIVATEGVSVVFAGPGDLSRAYDGDADAVESAIQSVLAACEQSGVPAGITAGPDDIAQRLEQGFRVIIVTRSEAIAVGRAALR